VAKFFKMSFSGESHLCACVRVCLLLCVGREVELAGRVLGLIDSRFIDEI
jgi:hypothetical protein